MISNISIVEIEYTRIEKRGHWEGSHYKSLKLSGTWSKWGGQRRELVNRNGTKKSIEQTWYCQSCSKPQPVELSPYSFQIGFEFFRICAECLSDGCSAYFVRIGQLQT